MSTHKMVASRTQEISGRKTILPDLRTAELLARWPLIGISMFILGSLMFGALFYNLRDQGPLLQWDRAIAATLPAIGLKSPPIVETLMDAGFYIGKELIMVLGVLLALYFLYKRFWEELTMAIIGWGGGALLFHFVSTAIGRVRPPTQIWIIVNIPGFPSGHAITTVIFYGFLAYLLVPKIPSIFWKCVVIAGALFIMGFVGFSRIFTGGHYLTDILSGYGVGIAWFGASFTLIELYFRRRRMNHVEKG